MASEKWLCTQGAGYCTHPKCQPKVPQCAKPLGKHAYCTRPEGHKGEHAMEVFTPEKEKGMWKVENPEEVTLGQILTKWDEVRGDDRCPECGASVTSPLTVRNIPGHSCCTRCGAVLSIVPKAEAKGPVKVVFVVEYTGQDEGCTHDVMQTLANHDYKLLEARFENPDGTTLDIMHLAQYVHKEEGKC